MRRERFPDAGRPEDQIMWRSKDIHGTSVKHVFYIKLTKTLNLLLLVTQDIILNDSGKKSSKQFMVQKKFNKNKTWSA